MLRIVIFRFLISNKRMKANFFFFLEVKKGRIQLKRFCYVVG